MPHAHILLFLHLNDKLCSIDMVNNIITTKILVKRTNPLLYDIIKKHMMHDPYGLSNMQSPVWFMGIVQNIIQNNLTQGLLWIKIVIQDIKKGIMKHIYIYIYKWYISR